MESLWAAKDGTCFICTAAAKAWIDLKSIPPLWIGEQIVSHAIVFIFFEEC